MKQKMILSLFIIALPLHVSAGDLMLSTATLSRQLQLNTVQQQQLTSTLQHHQSQKNALEDQYVSLLNQLQVDQKNQRQQMHEDQLRELGTFLSVDQVCRYENLMLMAAAGHEEDAENNPIVQPSQGSESASKPGWTVTFGGNPDKGKGLHELRGLTN